MAEMITSYPQNISEYPNSFKRQGAFPLEASEIFQTYQEANQYALTNPIAYIGQRVFVNESEKEYKIVDTFTDSKGSETALIEVSDALVVDELKVRIDNASSNVVKIYGGQIPEQGNITLTGAHNGSVARDRYITGLPTIPTSGEYADSNSKLRKAITDTIGTPDDSKTELTLHGLQKYTTELETALNFLADKDLIAKKPSLSFKSINLESYEVGTTITPSYELQLDPGLYEYAPTDTGVTPVSYTVKFNGVTKNTSKDSFDAVTVTDGMSLKLEASCTYSDGNIPINNLGLPYEAGKITSKITTKSATLSSYRNAFGSGVKIGGLVDGLMAWMNDYDQVNRPNSAKGDKRSFDIKIDGDAVQVFVAFPKLWGVTLKSVIDVNDSMKDITTSWKKQHSVWLPGADLSSNSETEYEWYLLEFASEYGGSGNTYQITLG